MKQRILQYAGGGGDIVLTQCGFVTIEDANKIQEFLRKGRFGEANEVVEGSKAAETSEEDDGDPEWPAIVVEAADAIVLLPANISDGTEVSVSVERIQEAEAENEQRFVMEFVMFFEASAVAPVPFSLYVPYLSNKLQYFTDHVIVRLDIDDVYGQSGYGEED